MVLNISYLCLLKYVNFSLSVLHLGAGANFYLPNLEFPLGISFFTLSQIMHLLDGDEGLLPAVGFTRGQNSRVVAWRNKDICEEQEGVSVRGVWFEGIDNPDGDFAM